MFFKKSLFVEEIDGDLSGYLVRKKRSNDWEFVLEDMGDELIVVGDITDLLEKKSWDWRWTFRIRKYEIVDICSFDKAKKILEKIKKIKKLKGDYYLGAYINLEKAKNIKLERIKITKRKINYKKYLVVWDENGNDLYKLFDNQTQLIEFINEVLVREDGVDLDSIKVYAVSEVFVPKITVSLDVQVLLTEKGEK